MKVMCINVYDLHIQGRPIDENDIIPDVGRGEVMRVWAQMECALKDWEDQ